ncbi:MAG: UDP-N-acetylmuramoyl-tripeptide--D-alanyl-D-alanine ligase, partial [Proteiniphilum sp.]|nr:UDP-N-acetylmuramoyl-tripeptide--D-alanyl-D-alanine ligase [Proteiniphilum sp.]
MQIAELYSLFLQYPLVTTDSRMCEKGSIFFALKGARFNGNQYAE